MTITVNSLMGRLLMCILFSSFSEALSFLSVATYTSVSSFCLILCVCVCVLVNQLCLHVLKDWPCLGDILWGPEAGTQGSPLWAVCPPTPVVGAVVTA